MIALNMADLLQKRGIRIDIRKLSDLLGCPVIETSALKRMGLSELLSGFAAQQRWIEKPSEADFLRRSGTGSRAGERSFACGSRGRTEEMVCGKIAGTG